MQRIVQVQIVIYNHEEYIKETLTNLFLQSYSGINLVIIDNLSKDKSRNIIKEKLKNCPFPFKVIWNNHNIGYAGAHNQGFNIALSNPDIEFVLTLNPDLILHPDYIRNLITAMSSYPSVGMATGVLVRTDGTIDSVGIGLNIFRRAKDIRNMPPSSDQLIFGPSGAAAIYKVDFLRSIQIENEFFDESFFVYKEDVDLVWRGQLFGWDGLLVTNALATHERGWKENDRTSVKSMTKIHSFKNRYLLIIKNDHLLNIILHLPFIIVYELAVFLYVVLKEPYLLQGYKYVFRYFFSALEKRRKIRRKTVRDARDIRKWLHNARNHQK